jgi:hypothetical protein
VRSQRRKVAVRLSPSLWATLKVFARQRGVTVRALVEDILTRAAVRLVEGNQ